MCRHVVFPYELVVDDGLHVRILSRTIGMCRFVPHATWSCGALEAHRLRPGHPRGRAMPLQPRQLVQVTQPKHLEKQPRGSVQERTSQLLGLADDPYQPAFHQLAKDLAALHAPNRVNVRPQYRLAVGDHGQGLQCRTGQPHLRRRRVKSPQPGGKLRPRHQLEPTGHLHDAERTAFAIVQPVERPDQCTRFGSISQATQHSQFSASQRLPSQEKDRLQVG